MLRAARAFLDRLHDPALAAVYASRRRLQFSPFPLPLYRDLLVFLRSNGGVVQDFLTPGQHGCANVYVRHDIDTADCVANLEATMDADLALGVRSGIYFRPDAEEYRLSDVAALVKSAHEKGFETGLHTSCYDYDRPLRKLREETEHFASIAGFKPKSFTLHGLGRRSYLTRLVFRNYIAHNLARFGYDFTDCHRSIRKYRYVIEDCHIDPENGRRFIYDDFKGLSQTLRPGSNLLILTHPCYWVA